MENVEPVVRHYTVHGIVDGILAALEASGKDLSGLTTADLASADEFHIRGREATLELLDLAGFEAPLRILDAGSGLGGPARVLAGRGCMVTGIDLTPEFCEGAARLSQMVGLSDSVEFHCASALAMPFESASFDGALTQHVQMNIKDKPAFYSEIRRVLKPGARFACHDIFAGPAAPPHYPAPWADDESLSWLVTPDAAHAAITGAGFREAAWHDRTATSRDWFLAMLERAAAPGPQPPGVAILLRGNGRQKMQNVARSLVENRIAVYMGVFEA